MWTNFDNTPFEAPDPDDAARLAALRKWFPPGDQTGPGALWGDRRSGLRFTKCAAKGHGRGAGKRQGSRQARSRSEEGLRADTSHRFVGKPHAVGAVHHARRAGGDLSGRLRRRLPDRPGSGRRRDRLRDDSRGSHHSGGRSAASSTRAFVSGTATRAGAGKATRSSSTSPTTTTRARSPRISPVRA